jgi:O-antigen biosynthesis protein
MVLHPAAAGRNMAFSPPPTRARLKAFLKAHNVHHWPLARLAHRTLRDLRWSGGFRTLCLAGEWVRLQQRRRLPYTLSERYGEGWYLQAEPPGIGNTVAWRKRPAASADPAPAPREHYALWNQPREDLFRRDIAHRHAQNPAYYDALCASIVMPAYNRQDSIGRAIESVIAQTHSNWQLYVVDDGSTDNTAAIIQSFAARDPRIHYLPQARSGVSSARNTALQAATGEYVFYLDSDNQWRPNFLRHMLVAMDSTGLDAAYSGLVARDDKGKAKLYRGEEFDWQACFTRNYVDINAFGHRRALLTSLPQDGFDTSIRRLVDWDFILRLTADCRVAFLPFIGVEYYDGSAGGRITHTEHLADLDDLIATIRGKHQPNAAHNAPINRPDWGELRWLHSPKRIAIKIPSPHAAREEWGDYHYAVSLKAAFEALGHQVHLDSLEQWYAAPASRDDITITLRGLSRYNPNPLHFNILWTISHPDKVSEGEYGDFDLVYIASQQLAAQWAAKLATPVAPLLQATDPARFRPYPPEEQVRSEVLFVGNSRNEFRPMVRWALECEAPLTLYGTRWEQFVGKEPVAGEHVPNAELGRHYAGARVVLNDHWDSMRESGIVSNRIFDVLACGGRLISDPLPAIGTLFGEHAVRQVGSAADMRVALAESPRLSREDALAMAERIHQQHSFAARARHILHDVYRLLGGRPLSAADAAHMLRPL